MEPVTQRSFRIPRRIYEALQKAAEDQGRTVSSLVLYYARRGLKEDGFLPGFERKAG